MELETVVPQTLKWHQSKERLAILALRTAPLEQLYQESVRIGFLLGSMQLPGIERAIRALFIQFLMLWEALAGGLDSCFRGKTQIVSQCVQAYHARSACGISRSLKNLWISHLILVSSSISLQ